MEPTNSGEFDDDEYSFIGVSHTESFLVPEDAIGSEGYEGEFMNGPKYKHTIKNNEMYTANKINRLRRNKKKLQNTIGQFSIISNNEERRHDYSPKEPIHEDSGEINFEYNEDECAIEEVSPSAHKANMSITKRSILNKPMKNKNEESNLMNEYSFIDIHDSDAAQLPVKSENTNAYSNIKGAFFEGLTNINYYLHDKGVYGLLGVKTLDFEEENLKRMLYNQEYQYYQKESFLSEFEKIIWFTYRNNFEGLLNRKKFLKITDFHKEIALHQNRKIYKSDNGWGCMIRVAQMITARVFYLLENDYKVLSIDENHFDDSNTTKESV